MHRRPKPNPIRHQETGRGSETGRPDGLCGCGRLDRTRAEVPASGAPGIRQLGAAPEGSLEPMNEATA